MNDHVNPAFAPALRWIAPPVSQRITATLTWIPVLEQCPEPGKDVLVSVAGEIEALPAWFDGTTWCHTSGHEIEGTVTHYCERPAGITP